MTVIFDFPLPPSKNQTKVAKSYFQKSRKIGDREGNRYVSRMVTTPAVYAYRIQIKSLITLSKAYRTMTFNPKVKTVFRCWWRKPNNRWDCHNWHQELADAICPVIGVNDRYVLIQDIDYVLDAHCPGVTVEISQGCETSRFSSRVCERGTKGCVIGHNHGVNNVVSAM